jgi:DNA-binding HxlR family transcriptional regulator
MQKRAFNCPAEMTLHLIGGKWRVIVLWLLHKGPQRSGKLKSRLPGITPAAFSRAVRELEASHLVRRRASGTYPPAVSYELTVEGVSLSPLVKAMVKWGLAHSETYLAGEFGMAAFYRK